jgi:hypothetical protein
VNRVAFAIGIIACFVTAGCRDPNPFEQVPVSGTILYEDGSVIPAKGIRLIFDSQAPPADAARFPRPASALVDVFNGSFASATTYRHGDGLVRGKHKVVLDIVPPTEGNTPLVPPEYLSAKTTPLIVDTDSLPLELRVPQP